jgi:hypothetical protein
VCWSKLLILSDCVGLWGKKMNWPPEEICELISNIRLLAIGSSYAGESGNAWAALRKIQTEFGLNDVELTFIAEYQANAPMKSRGRSNPERPPNALEEIINLFEETDVILPLEQSIVNALWTLHTHVFRQFMHTPRLILRSFEEESGKTVVLSRMEPLVNNAFMTSDITAPVLYYQLHDHPDTTFLLDEGEHSSLWDPDSLLVRVFNSGHRQGGNTARVIGRKAVRFATFAPLALALVQKRSLSWQSQSRSIFLDIYRRLEGLDELLPNNLYTIPRAVIQTWASEFKDTRSARLPSGIRGRAANNWRPLIEIAHSLGYGATAYAAAAAIHQPHINPVNAILSGIWQIFEQREKQCEVSNITCNELPAALHGLEGSHWQEFTGVEGNKPVHKVTMDEIHQLLHTKRIHTRTIWRYVNGERVSMRGYDRSDFEPAWRQMGYTVTQPSKIIRLAHHKRGTPGNTD